MQKVLILEKKSVYQLDLNLQPPECKSAALPIELYVLWFSMEHVARIFSTSLPSICCQMQADHRINLW